VAFGVVIDESVIGVPVPIEDIGALAPVDVDLQRIGDRALVHRFPASRVKDAEKAVNLR
jgi:hypothetical protein